MRIAYLINILLITIHTLDAYMGPTGTGNSEPTRQPDLIV